MHKSAISYGIMKTLEEHNIIHYCCTDYDSSGLPILKLSNNKIIGKHKDTIYRINNTPQYNRGTLLTYPIFDFLNKINEK